ncbi:T9SS type A sorting domain-containing protein [Maribellus sp. CM-23]|uniref:T9SS type A sorting domain-containing protein n=1 Tax=Maribellus sp. CM-23 TaxID=2781026 RepID=UPI001F164842|nr:T9SS type A sorting domain-containing protein [Maribellus sp. CM-23]MCE4566034.1 T9SS type A sorting domain-containing protein [Maribellus sp. CM-23]
MKQLILLSLILFSINVGAQTVITLNFNQPPEFGFMIGLTDTTIVHGDSIMLGQDLTIYGGSGEYSFFWTPGSSLSDSTIMNPHANPEDTTTYELTVVDNYGCSFSVNYTVNVRAFPVSVDFGIKESNSIFVKLFPNPNDGKFKVELSGNPQDEINLIIIDNMGRIIHKKVLKNFTGNQIETMEMTLPSGMYMLLIKTDSDKLQRQFIIN